MSRRRKIVIALAGIVVVALVVAAGLYLRASVIPEAYRPAVLTQAQKRAVASDDFVPHLAEFGNDAGRAVPFTWSVTARQLNEYLASMDEIADFLRPGPGRAGEVTAALDEAHLASPAAALQDGLLTLMIRQSQANKILSMDVGFSFTEAGLLRVHLRRMRIGLLKLPPWLVRSWQEQIKSMLLEQLGSYDRRRAGSALSGVTSEDLGLVLSKLLLAMDGAPIEPELVWPIGRKRVRIEQVGITPEAITLHARPVLGH